MMKNLLFATALLVAASASAQQLNKVDIQKNVSLENMTAKSVKALDKHTLGNNTAAKKAQAKAIKNMYTAWMGTELATDENVTNAFEMSMEEVNVKDEEGNIYNVQIKDFWQEGTTMLGIYDAEAGTLRIPAQDICESTTDLGYTNDYGPLTILSLRSDEDNSVGFELVFVENEGTFELADSLAGYYIYAFEFEGEGGQKGTGWTYAWDVRLAKMNGIMDFRTTAKNFQTTEPKEGSSWAGGTYPINFQDWDISIQINGFPSRADGMRGGCVTIDLNDDGTATMMMGQQLSDYYYGEGKGYMRLVGVAQDEEGYINIDPTVESITGEYHKDIEVTTEIKGDVIAFYTVDEEGYYATNEYICPLNDSQEYWIGGYFCGLEFDLFPFYLSDVDGISDNHVTLEQRLKNTKTYNLMGQQVNRKEAGKGLLIRDGKKFFKK